MLERTFHHPGGRGRLHLDGRVGAASGFATVGFPTGLVDAGSYQLVRCGWVAAAPRPPLIGKATSWTAKSLE